MSRILAADIGGTNARFADVAINSLADISISRPLVFPTWSDSVDSFDQLLAHYSENRPPGTPALAG